MMRPRALRLVALLLALRLGAGCGGVSDGGPVGTGITASVAGNVVAVETTPDQAASPATADGGGAPAAIPTVEVSIDEVPGAVTTTDADGNFTLDGDFAGALTLRFRVSGLEATQSIDVPAGSLVVLADIELAPGMVDALAGRQVGFLGRLVTADCAAGILTVEDENPRANQFAVNLLEETRIVRPDGTPLTCAEIPTGQRLAIEGAIDLGGGGLTALSVTVGAKRRPRPDVIEGVPLLGRAAAIDCNKRLLVIADEGQRTRLRLPAGTDIARPDGTPLDCRDIGLGNQVAGQGRLDVRRPGTIEATSLVVTAATRPDLPLRLAGVVVATDCSVSLLQIAQEGVATAVRLRPGTMIEPPLGCGEILPGARVQGTGRVSRELPGVIDAVRLRIRQPATRSAARRAESDSQP